MILETTLEEAFKSVKLYKMRIVYMTMVSSNNVFGPNYSSIFIKKTMPCNLQYFSSSPDTSTSLEAGEIFFLFVSLKLLSLERLAFSFVCLDLHDEN